jgi:hypothetical protein
MRQRSWGLASLFIIVCLAVGQSANHSQPRPTVPDTHSDEEIAVSLERQGWEAAKAKDAASYERLLAEDFVRVGADGVTTKNGEKNDFDQLAMDTYKWEGLQVVHFTPDVTLLAYKATQKTTYRGQPLPSPTWISSLWIKRNGTWLNVFYQETKAE